MIKAFRIVVLFLATALSLRLHGAELPSNLGLGLRNLVQTYQQDRTQFRAKVNATKVIQADASDRVIVNVHLDGTRAADEVANDLRRLGLEILFVETNWRKGVISARLPLDQATAAATLSGVRSVLLAPRPIHHVGNVTAESSGIDRAQQVNAKGAFTASGILGKGISVGIVSDSYDADQSAPRASVGVASGDLPGAGNPDGYTQPVVVIDDNFAPGGGQTDEGRAMAEIVHDIAPAAKLAFSTVQQTQSIMAFSIRNLRANQDANCDIIVDDVFFSDEPMFSDGPLALAVEDVVNGTSLPGKKVVYFSAAGNEANHGYSSDLQLLSVTQGLAANAAAADPQIPLDFSTVPPALYAGGFHNVNSPGDPAIAMPVTSEFNQYLDFQWDDPFDKNAVTTDYNLLVFDQDGNYQGLFSGTDNNISTDEPIEMAFVGSDQTFYLVISLATPAHSQPVATHLRFVAPSGPELSGPYISYEAPSMIGHATAASANAVAAYVYNSTPARDPNYNPNQANPPPGPYKPAREDYTSNGGALAFYFDAQGNRLMTPQIRLKPDMAAADGVDTTFFGDDTDNDTFPNFFGTSAAAPTAAGVAALMLEAAGGPLKLTAAQIRTKLQTTAIPHDLDPFFCTAIATDGLSTVEVVSQGNASNDSAFSPDFFTLTFTGRPGQTLNTLDIDLTNAGLVFDFSPDTGFPFTYESIEGNVTVVATFSQDRRVLSLNFAGTFHPGDVISFGVDRDFAATNAGGNSADLLAGSSITAQTAGINPTTLQGAFANQLGNGYTFADGYGLVDAKKAVESIRGKLTTTTGVPRNVSTRAFVETDDNILIGGFIIQGSAAKNVVIRALGPSLQNNGVPIADRLLDPTLQLFDANGNSIASDDNWQDDPNQAAQIQSSGFAPGDPRESVILRALVPGSYTAVVRGKNATMGNALMEVYDRDGTSASTQLANVSSRGQVQTGDNVMIGGFIISGNNAANVIVRALGPSLMNSGLSGTLADPTLEVFDANGNSIASNDNWQQDSEQAIEIESAGLAPGDAVESGAALSLTAGGYTTVVRGKNNSTGLALVEVYNVH